MTTMKLARLSPPRLVAAALVLAALALPGLAGGTQGVLPTVPHALPSYHGTFNPHLHGYATQSIASGRPTAPAVGAVVRTGGYTRWRGRHWNSVAWFALHRGTGTIEGLVHNGAGEPMAGMSVRLRDSHGHGFRSAAAKHVTTTGSGGSFLMRHVRAGTYRVHAEAHGQKGDSTVRLHAGQVAMVTIKA